MIFRSAPLFLLPLLLLSAPAHAVVTVLVEEVDNGEGGTDVVATATGSIDRTPFTSTSNRGSKIDLSSKTFTIGLGNSDFLPAKGVSVSISEVPIWTGEDTSTVFPSEGEYRSPGASNFSTNSEYLVGVDQSVVWLSEKLWTDLGSNSASIGTIRSTWANQSFPDLGIAYNSTWTIEWDGGGENKTLTYTAVPEPSQYGLLFGLAAAFAAVGLRRRRRAGGNS